jgi:hypothetical protein
MAAPTLPGFTTFTIPVVNSPQSFSIALAGVTYNITCKWNDAPGAGWVLDLADVNNNPLAGNIPLITGEDCLAGLEYLGVGGQLIVYTNGDDFAVPTLDNLGVESNLYFLTEDSTNA